MGMRVIRPSPTHRGGTDARPREQGWLGHYAGLMHKALPDHWHLAADIYAQSAKSLHRNVLAFEIWLT